MRASTQNPVIHGAGRDSTKLLERRYVISGVYASVCMPEAIARVLDVTLLHVPRHDQAFDIKVTARQTLDSWEIADAHGVLLTLPARTAAPDVAGSLCSALVECVLPRTDAALVQGVIIAKGDFAVALVGGDWESGIAVAMHLSLRGWTLLTARYAFVDPQTRVVEPFSKLLYVPSRVVPLLPLEYRAALESSPWYYTGSELGFYGVDPFNLRTSAWNQSATLRAALVIDESRRELLGSVKSPAHVYVGSCLPFSGIGIASASLVVGGIVSTADAVEVWASSLIGPGTP